MCASLKIVNPSVGSKWAGSRHQRVLLGQDWQYRW